jgi:large subunit ribosomal protein L3
LIVLNKMAGFILGEKQNQKQVFDDRGERVVVTEIKTNPCYLVDLKLPAKHGYFAVRLGYGNIKNIKKPILKELEKAGIKAPLHFLSEFRLEKFGGEVAEIEEEKKKGLSIGETKIFVGDELKPTAIFKKGEVVTVVGRSKGKGFAGVVKRHGFAGGPKTHGQSDRHRAPGSIGQTTTPGRVMKGKRMAGRMGGVRTTIKNLEIFDVKDDSLIIKGLVPGPTGGLIKVQTSK